MNIKSLLIGCAAAMIAMCGISSAAQLDPSPGSTVYAHPEVGFGPHLAAITGDVIDTKVALGIEGVVLKLGTILGDSGSVIAPQAGLKNVKVANDGGTIFLAGVIKPNNPMPLVEKLAKRTHAPAPGGTTVVQPVSTDSAKPVDVTTEASADIPIIIEGGGSPIDTTI